MEILQSSVCFLGVSLSELLTVCSSLYIWLSSNRTIQHFVISPFCWSHHTVKIFSKLNPILRHKFIIEYKNLTILLQSRSNRNERRNQASSYLRTTGMIFGSSSDYQREIMLRILLEEHYDSKIEIHKVWYSGMNVRGSMVNQWQSNFR